MGVLLTKKQASIFILLKHGLIGDYKFEGKNGILAFVAQAGCIQYDPIDICARIPSLSCSHGLKDLVNRCFTPYFMRTGN